MKRAAIFIAAVAVSIGGLVRAQDQSFQPSADEESLDDQTLTVDVDEVSVLFTVTDDDGRYVTGLTADDFVVFEDRVPQEITVFEAENDLPLLMGLVIDVSGSVRDKLRFEQEAAIEFFYSTLERDRDQAMLIAFDTGVTLLQDFTHDPEDLAVAVDKLRAGGSSALYDAVWLAVSEKMAGAQGEMRRILIVISDGDDTASRKSLTEALELSQKNDVSIYAISTNSTAFFANDAQERGDRALETFAGETGGRAFFPFKIEELAVNFAEISDDIRNQYTIGYISTNVRRDGRFRRIQIQPRNNDHNVTARSGYYAPNDETSEED
jgi:Ca-activated chloride channel family protein